MTESSLRRASRPVRRRCDRPAVSPLRVEDDEDRTANGAPPGTHHRAVPARSRPLAPGVYFSRQFLDRLISRLRGDRDLASDVVVRLLEPRVRTKYEPSRGSLLDFAIGVARYVRLERGRLSRTRVRTVLLETSLEALVSPVGRGPSEDARRLRLEQELARLSPQDRAVLARRFGLDGAVVDGSPQSGRDRSRLARALGRLRIRLADVA